MIDHRTTAAPIALIQRELSRRLEAYRSDVASGRMTRDEANKRYLCLQTAAHLLGAKGQPAIAMPRDVVLDELTRWQKDLQRGATYETMRAVARDIADIAVAMDCVKAATQG